MKSANEYISALTDGSPFEVWDDLTGSDAVVTGQATIDGEPVSLIVSEFSCFGGSMGETTGGRIASAFLRACHLRMPVVAVVRSGGVRVHEGVPAFVQMIRTVDAVEQFARRGGFFLAYLAGPVMGGVLASWVGQAQVTMAAPGARVGLLGPRTTRTPRSGSGRSGAAQMVEAWYELGRVDELVAPQHLRNRVHEILAFVRAARGERMRCIEATATAARSPSSPRDELPTTLGAVWKAVSRSRAATRMRAPELLETAAKLVVELRGDGVGDLYDRSSIAGLYRWRDLPVVVFAQVNGGPTGLRPRPAAYRKAQRCMRLAQELGLPLINVVDTIGAEAEPASPAEDISIDISRCLRELLIVPVPTVCVLLGEGTGGAAIAHVPADVVVAAEYSWLAPLAPEASSRLVWKSDVHAAEAALMQQVSAWQLASLGVVDRVVPQSSDDEKSTSTFGTRLADAVAEEIRSLSALDSGARMDARRARYGVEGLVRCS